MTQTKYNLSSSEKSMFNEIAVILNNYKGSTRNFGLSLIHSHFLLKKDEALHETNNKKTRTLTVRTIKKNMLPKNAHPTMWTLTKSGKAKVAQFCCDD
jgi:hypothetical protein